MKISIRSILSDRRIVIIAVAFAVCNMGFVSSTLWIPKFLVDVDGFSIASSGLALGLYSLSGGVGAIVIGWLSDRLGRLRITAIASITAAFLGLIYYLSMGYPYAARIAFSVLLGFFSYAYLSLSVAAAQDLTDPSVLGSVTGVVQNIAFISLPIGPLLSGVLIAYTEISYALAMSISLPFIVHGIVFSLLSLRGFKHV